MSLLGLWRWRERGGNFIHIALPFDDIMEFALALLSISPEELARLDWTFADRKRLLDHLLASGKTAQAVPHGALPATLITLRLPRDDVARLQQFARREFSQHASNAAMLDRVLDVLNAAAG